MYNIEALRRKIAKEGVENTIDYLLSDNLPLHIKQDLEKELIFDNGHLCLSLVYSLA